MKKYISLLIIVFSLSATAQNIIINGTNVNVSQDVSFPYWLDSMATIEIGSQVVSISALEFNIVPTTNGNSLVFSQTKTITSEETVPNGKTWKIEGVLLDSTAVNNSSSSGGGQVIVSGGVGNMAVALSEQSSNSMNMGAAMLYCDNLTEDGYNNWIVPTLEELMYVAGGGGEVPGTRTSDWLSTITPIQTSQYGGEDEYYRVRLSDGNLLNSTGSAWIRCVRHESISVSGSGSSSGGSNTSNSNALTISGIGVYSPDSLKYWKVESINLVQANTSLSFTLPYNGCGGANSPLQWVCNYQALEQVLIKFGLINYSVTPDNLTHNLGSVQYCNCSCNDCPSTLLSNYILINTVFKNLNFPIYIHSDELIEVFFDGIVLSITEYSTQ